MNPINKIKHLFKTKELVDNAANDKQIQDINKRDFIKKGIFGIGIGAAAALLSKIPFARAVQNVNYDNSTDGMSISSDGIVSLSNQSGCSVYNSGQSISATSEEKVEFATERYDTKNEFDNSTNYRFTATETGKYLVTFASELASVATDKATFNTIKKNGTSILQGRGHNPHTAQAIQQITSGVIDLAASDYLEAYHHNNDTSARSLESANYVTHMSIHKLS